LGDLRRFEKARQLTSYVGLAPFRWESGKSVKGRTRMSKRGNSWVRRALYMSAMSATVGRLPIPVLTLLADGTDAARAVAASAPPPVSVRPAWLSGDVVSCLDRFLAEAGLPVLA